MKRELDWVSYEDAKKRIEAEKEKKKETKKTTKNTKKKEGK